MEIPHPEPLGRTDPRRTWRIADDRRLPALEPIADRVHPRDPVVLREHLWDTDDRVLAAEGVELLASDVGWSVDRGDGPVPVDPDHEPRDVVEVFLRGRPVRVVRVRDTVTTLVELRGRDGRLRAEVADVRVDEGEPDGAVLRSSRWWALSDDGRDGTVSRAAERALADAAEPGPGGGVRGAGGRSGAGRSTGPGPTERRKGTAARPRRGSAAAALRTVLRSLRADLVEVDPSVRADEQGSVHELRKVLRRLRSVLAAYRGALDPDATEALRTELAEVSRVAGVARDAEVLGDRLLRAAGRAPEGFVAVETLDRIGSQVAGSRAAATADLRRMLRSATWFGALDHLDDLIARAPRGPHADDDAHAFAVRRIIRERKRVVAAIDDASGTLDDLHEIRKAARRLRYASEAAGDGADLGKRRLGLLRRVQDGLGEVLDAAHVTAALRELASLAAETGADTFGDGVLATIEHAVVERERERAERRVARLRSRVTAGLRG